MKSELSPLFVGVILTSFLTITSNVKAAESSIKDIDFYASIRLGVDNIDAGTSDDGANGRDFLSRIGAKASIKIDDNLTAVTRVEYGLREENAVDLTQNNGPTLRQAYVGLKGDFGEVYFGSQTLLWNTYVRSAYFSDGIDTIRQGNVRDDDLLQYFYKQGNWNFGAGLQFKGQDGSSVDQMQLGGEYKSGPYKVQAAWSKDNQGDNKGNLYGLRGWWDVNDAVTLSAFVHKATNTYDIYGGSSTGTVRLKDADVEGSKNAINACSSEDRTSSGLYASYQFGKNKIHTRYAIDSCDISGDVDSVKIEYIRYLSKALRAWVAYEDLSNDEQRKPTTSSGKDMSQLQAGVRFDF
ncbi:porin [Pseudoalteromonas sp. SG41-2]|uniref:porin n=1 Tax=Pseudoalteromonas sp. SG41-2 TaxID=2760978 RepID=UPI001602AF6B|nr:porin [Pseudoalteromonas sp. SG41-2]MBB1481618.1 porin [Pseudoalteromonas sp. SG41-2]